jgi:hypothetical protein
MIILAVEDGVDLTPTFNGLAKSDGRVPLNIIIRKYGVK